MLSRCSRLPKLKIKETLSLKPSTRCYTSIVIYKIMTQSMKQERPNLGQVKANVGRVGIMVQNYVPVNWVRAQKQIGQSGIEAFGDSRVARNPNDSLDIGEGAFLVDVFWPLLAASVQKKMPLYKKKKLFLLYQGHMTKHSNIMQIIAK